MPAGGAPTAVPPEYYQQQYPPNTDYGYQQYYPQPTAPNTAGNEMPEAPAPKASPATDSENAYLFLQNKMKQNHERIQPK